MKRFRPILLCLVVVSFFLLTGFKANTSKHEPKTKSQLLEEVRKPLDLSVPNRALSFEEMPEQLTIVQSRLPQAIDSGSSTKMSTLELQGKVIATQQQEVEKLKTADGAGIVINLHH